MSPSSLVRVVAGLIGAGLILLGLGLGGHLPELDFFEQFGSARGVPPSDDIELVPNGRGTPRGVLLSEEGIFFAPFTGFPQELLERLRHHYAEEWGFDVEILGEISIEGSARPEGNSQLDAFELDDQVQRAYLLTEPGVVIGFLTQDVRAYATGDFWNFGAVNLTGYAVISTARMDPRSFGQPENEGLLMERLTKMTTRYIALVYYQLPRSTDPSSVLFESIRSQADLDGMTEWPCPRRPGYMTACRDGRAKAGVDA
jgi:predicted Zn-dependent protease